MKKFDLNTNDGQYAAGLFCAKHYWTTSKRTEEFCDRLNTRALIHRIYSEAGSRLEAERKLLQDAWDNGVMEGKRIRK